MEPASKNESFEVYQKHLLRKLLNSDEVIRKYIKDQEIVSQSMVNDLYGLYSKIKTQKMLIMIGKSVVKSVIINVKDGMMSLDLKNASLKNKTLGMVRSFMGVLHPENISSELTDDEYVTLVGNIIAKNKTQGPSNIYILIATNMIMSMVSTNLDGVLASLAGNKNYNDESLTDDEFSNLYNKIKVASLPRKRQVSEVEAEGEEEEEEDGASSVISSSPTKKKKYEFVSFQDMIDGASKDEEAEKVENVSEEYGEEEVEVEEEEELPPPPLELLEFSDIQQQPLQEEDEEENFIGSGGGEVTDLFSLFKDSENNKIDTMSDDSEAGGHNNDEEMEVADMENETLIDKNEEIMENEEEGDEGKKLEVSDVSEENRTKIDRMLAEYKLNAMMKSKTKKQQLNTDSKITLKFS
ncbi:GbNV-gb67-like [Penaeus vannamei nudivirus]|nr:hypothetical protein PvSNPV_080 [Penaeus vannamei nucleopolyhedrovirus]